MKRSATGNSRTREKTSAVSENHSIWSQIHWYSSLLAIAVLPIVHTIVRGAPTGALTDDPYHAPKFLAVSILATIATLGWAVDSVVAQRPMRTHWTQGIALGIGVLIILSTALGYEPLGSLFGASELLTGASTWLLALWMGFLIQQGLRLHARLKQLTFALSAGAIVVSCVAILQALGIDPLGVRVGPEGLWAVSQGSSTLGNPDYTGLFLILPAVALVGLALSSQSPVERNVSALAAAVVAVALVLTLTRAAWLGLTVGVVLFLWLALRLTGARSRRAVWIIVASTLAVIIAGVVLAGPDATAKKIGRANEGVDRFTSGRVTLWSDTLSAVGERWATGTGADRLALGVYPNQTEVVTVGDSGRLAVQDPHNFLLLFAGLFGAPAALTLLAYIGVVLYQALKRAATRSDTTGSRVLYAAWVSGVTGYLAASLLSVYSFTAPFVLFIGLGVASVPALTGRESRKPMVALVAVAGAVVCLVASFGAVRSYQASALVAQSFSGDSQARLERAIALTPWDTRIRVEYQWRKITAYRAAIQGPDRLSAAGALEMLDSELVAQIATAPHELLFYRMRIDLYRLAEGYPGFDLEALQGSIESALDAFPTDPEFLELQEQYGSPSTG